MFPEQVFSPDRDALLAHYYDLEYRDHNEDTEFYRQYAAALDADTHLPLLELGCGTGRNVVALAVDGFVVTGVDVSAGMLHVARLAAQTKGCVDRVALVRADMRVLDGVLGPFNVAFCALNTFAYLETTADQLAMLGAVRERLVQHGVLILDLTPPLPHLLPPSGGETIYAGSYPDPQSGGILHKMVSGYADPSLQLHQVTLFYDLELPDGTLRRTTQPQTFRWSGRYEVELLLQAAGYRLEEIYGDYDLGAFSVSSERMIFVART